MHNCDCFPKTANCFLLENILGNLENYRKRKADKNEIESISDAGLR